MADLGVVWHMRVFIAAMVAACGIGAFAVAALLWDRRAALAALGGLRFLAVGLTLLLGVGLLAGSCVGLLRF